MPSEKSGKRGRGRPHGVKDHKPRRFKPRLIVPMEQQVLTKPEAAAVSSLGISKIDQNLEAIGAVRSGTRVLIFRDRLMAYLRSLPPAVPPPFLRRELAVVPNDGGGSEIAASSVDGTTPGDPQIDTAAGTSNGKCYAVNAENGRPENKTRSRADRLQKLDHNDKLNKAVVTVAAKKMQA